MDLTKADIEKIETGVRGLRESLAPFHLGVELVCEATYHGRSYACDVVEPYGWCPEGACPFHD